MANQRCRTKQSIISSAEIIFLNKTLPSFPTALKSRGVSRHPRLVESVELSTIDYIRSCKGDATRKSIRVVLVIIDQRNEAGNSVSYGPKETSSFVCKHARQPSTSNESLEAGGHGGFIQTVLLRRRSIRPD